LIFGLLRPGDVFIESSHPEKSLWQESSSSWPSGPTGLLRPSASACTCGPAWRTAPLSPDGLCRETTPPTRPEGSGEKLSFSHRNFAPIAPSREPVIVGRPGLPLTSTIACQASQPALTTASHCSAHRRQSRAQPCLPGSHGHAATRRCCPQPRKECKAGERSRISLRVLCAFVPLW
jgi:hypothetical protein